MTDKYKSYFAWFAFMFCFSLIPILMLIYGQNYLVDQKLASETLISKRHFSSYCDQLKPFKTSEVFWCDYLTRNFQEGVFPKQNRTLTVANKLGEIKKHLNIEYLLYQYPLVMATSTVTLTPIKDWKLTLTAISRYLFHKKKDPSFIERKAISRALGPQFTFRHITNAYSSNKTLIWPDSKNEKPVLFIKKVHDLVVMIFIKPDALNTNAGLWTFMKNFQKDPNNKFMFAGVEEEEDQVNFIYDLPVDKKQELDEGISLAIKQNKSVHKTQNHLLFKKFIRPGFTMFGAIALDELEQQNATYYIFLLFALILTSIFIGKYSHKIFIQQYPDNTSIKWKLRFLFFFANGLPLVVLFFIGNDYLNQKYGSLLKETHQKGISFLQSLDKKFETKYSKYLLSKEKGKKELIKSLRKKPLNKKILNNFKKALGTDLWKLFLVASQSKLVGTIDGMWNEDKNIIPENFDSEENKKAEFTRKIGQFFLSQVNNTKISEKVSTEMELILESVAQKSLRSFLNEILLAKNRFTQWGFGQKINPSIIDTVKVHSKKYDDYFIIAIWNKRPFQKSFLDKNITKFNRNNFGLKVVAHGEKRLAVPQEIRRNKDIVNFANSLSNYPSTDLRIVEYKNKKNLAMGFKGKAITSFKLIGLYPVEKINQIIHKQRNQLLIFGCLSLLMTLTLSQILAQSFLVPLNQLTSGALAIEHKQFKHRLPDLGKDEFGEMGKVFNDVMIDLEELSAASAIQEQLLPKTIIPTGRFSLYGKSVSMSELGGDYFDYSELADGKFSILLGDVAGHGVGAALIMAMAKAGIIQSEDLLDKPLELITKLHKLIYSSKTKKQRKIMTCQYLYADGETGKAIYTNAGACSPMIVRKKEGIVEELTLAGAALGAFKRAKYSETEVSFAPGDAIVFYTDGIIESRNEADEEIGYEGFKEILLKSWNKDAETFYNNIYQIYLDHLGNMNAQDDLTMVVLVFGKNSEDS
jgi:hypothetical protein